MRHPCPPGRSSQYAWNVAVNPPVLSSGDFSSNDIKYAEDQCLFDKGACLDDVSLTCFPAVSLGVDPTAITIEVHKTGGGICVSSDRYRNIIVVSVEFVLGLLGCIVAFLISYLLSQGSWVSSLSRVTKAWADDILGPQAWSVISMLLQATLLVVNVGTDILVVMQISPSHPSQFTYAYVALVSISFALPALILNACLMRAVVSSPKASVAYASLTPHRFTQACGHAKWPLSLLVVWPVLTLTDVMIVAFHAVSFHSWFRWLNVSTYMVLHVYVVGAIQSPISFAIVTYVYAVGMSSKVRFYMTDWVFLSSALSSILHILVCFSIAAIAGASGSLGRWCRKVFWELVKIEPSEVLEAKEQEAPRNITRQALEHLSLIHI